MLKTIQQYYTFVLTHMKHTSPPTQSSYPFCLALWGRLLAPSCYADLHFSLLLGTSVITACYADSKPGVHQHSDVWLPGRRNQMLALKCRGGMAATL